MSPFCAWSLRKWCLISICLVLECCIGTLMALVLSHFIGTYSKDKLKLLRVCFIQKICAQQKPTTMYSPSIVDKATEFCFLLSHETSECPKKWLVSLVFFLSTLHSTKSASEYPINSKLLILGYYNPMSIVPFKYLKILFKTLKCDSLGQDWNLAHKYTLYMILGLLASKYNKEPIMPLYMVKSIDLPFSSLLSLMDELIRVFILFASSILNLLRKIFNIFSLVNKGSFL